MSTAHTRRAKVVVGGAQALRPRAAARRQTGRPRLAQQVGSPEPKHTKLGTGGHVQTPAAQNPVEGAFVAAAERLKTKARGRTVPVASPPPSVYGSRQGPEGAGAAPPFPGVHASAHPAFPLDSRAGRLRLVDGGEKGGFVAK